MLTRIDPRVRAALYWLWIISYLAVLITDAVYRVIGGTPSWLGPLAEWLLLVGAAVGFIAAGNTLPVTVDPTALPPSARKIIYSVLSVASLVVFLASEFFRLQTGGDPWYVDLANAIVMILSTAFGFVAASHVVPSPPPADKAQPEAG